MLTFIDSICFDNCNLFVSNIEYLHLTLHYVKYKNVYSLQCNNASYKDFLGWTEAEALYDET